MIRNAPHRIALFTTTEGGIDPDYGTPIPGETVQTAVVSGIFGVLTAEETLAAGTLETNNVTAAARVPHGTVVAITDTVQVVSPVDPSLAGTWAVKAIRWNRDHIRLMLAIHTA